MKIKSYKDLEVWQKGIDLVKDIYSLVSYFSKDELYGLISQMRRSAISIPSNISEGFMRQHTNKLIQFLYISLGSCGELDTQLEVAERLGFLVKKETIHLQDRINHISRMLRNLIKSLRTTSHESRTTKHGAKR